MPLLVRPQKGLQGFVMEEQTVSTLFTIFAFPLSTFLNGEYLNVDGISGSVPLTTIPFKALNNRHSQ